MTDPDNFVANCTKLADDIANAARETGYAQGYAACLTESAAKIAELEHMLAGAKKALRACYSWHIAERQGIGNLNACMELCQYSEWLTAQWLGMNGAEYSGVPHMIVWPQVDIDRCSEENAQALVDEVFAHIDAKLSALSPERAGGEGK